LCGHGTLGFLFCKILLLDSATGCRDLSFGADFMIFRRFLAQKLGEKNKSFFPQTTAWFCFKKLS
jgi:hypothetical protein